MWLSVNGTVHRLVRFSSNRSEKTISKIKKYDMKNRESSCSRHLSLFLCFTAVLCVSLTLFLASWQTNSSIDRVYHTLCTQMLSVGRRAVWSCPRTANALPALSYNFPVIQTVGEREAHSELATLCVIWIWSQCNGALCSWFPKDIQELFHDHSLWMRRSEEAVLSWELGQNCNIIIHF